MIPRIPFKPIDAGYAVTPGDGTQRIQLDGGSGRYRAGVSNMSNSVEATWALFGSDYAAFMGFYRIWLRSGGQSFKIALTLDSSTADDYDARFIPGSVRLTSKTGPLFTVTATLEVDALTRYEDPATDPYADIYELLPFYGSFDAIAEMLNLFEKLVNRDWPHA